MCVCPRNNLQKWYYYGKYNFRLNHNITVSKALSFYVFPCPLRRRRVAPLFILSICTLGYLYATSDISLAQVTSDGTLNTQVNQDGNVAEITGGESRGSNLFHSFREFSVRTGNEAFFNNADSISNIFSRVTGGKVSSIDGLIRANSASLFLINPKGIIFGKNAKLDLGGSFYGSSGSSILFEDGEFSAVDNLDQPILTINAPIGLGFRDNPGDIVNRSVGENPNGETNVTDGPVGLQVPNGETLAIVGGNVLLDDGNLTAKGGQIEIGSVLGAGEVGISETDTGFVFDYDSINSFGDITLENTAVVDVTASGGGSIDVNGNNLTISNSSLNSGIASDSNSSEAQAGNITINATEAVKLNNSGDINNEVNFGIGNAGDINNEVNFGIGNAGDITIRAGSLSVIGESSIDSRTSGLGNAGNVFIEAQEITFSDSNIFTEVSSDGGIGNAGDIDIITNSLSLQEGSAFLADTENQGNAGNISIEARDTIVIAGRGENPFPSQITSTVDTANNPNVTGDAGNIEINTGSLSFIDGGFISASTLGRGNGGNITINAKGTVSFDGRDETDEFPSAIFTSIEPNAEGDGGNININAESLELTNRAQIPSNVEGIGDAGDINIQVENEVNLVNSILISEVTAPDENGEGGRGNGGDINITTGSLFLRDGSSLLADTENQGDAGNINIKARDSVVLEGEGRSALVNSTDIVPSQITSTVDIETNPDVRGDAGDIEINTDSLSISDGGFINTSGSNLGVAGDIEINTDSLSISDGSINTSTFSVAVKDNGIMRADNANDVGGELEVNTNSLTLENGASISAENTSDTGTGGSIDLNVNDTLQMRDNSLISARATEGAIGGNIDIDTDFIVAFPNQIDGNGSDIIANAVRGNGGIININAESLFGIQERQAIDNNRTNDIDASSDFGLDGTVSIFTPDINPVQGVTELPNNVVEAEQTVAQVCKSDRLAGKQSGLVVKGKGGIPPTPDLPLNSHNIFINGEINSASVIPPPIETSQGKIQPARGIKVTETGGVILTAYQTNNTGERVPEIKGNCN